MNSPHHPHHDDHDVHQQRLLWFFSFCNQRSGGGGSGNNAKSSHERGRRGCRRIDSNRNKFAIQYQQQLQQQQRQTSNVFGLDLIEHTQKFGDTDSVPHIVKSCTRFIEQHGIIFGIYRLSGMRVNIHRLRQDFDRNPKITMIDSEAISNDSHAVACVLKQYFRELPTPLLTFHMYERFIELFKQSNTNNNNNDDETNHNINPNHNGGPESGPIEEERRQQTEANRTHQDNSSGQSSGTQEKDEDVKPELDDKINNPNQINIDNENQNNSSSKETKPCDVSCTKLGTSATSSPAEHIKTSASTTTSKATTVDTSASITQQPMRTTKSSLTHQQSAQPAMSRSKEEQQPARGRFNKPPFTTSASDSQLISLSSVVTTTTADVKYQFDLDELKKLLQQLPRAHYETLKYLMRHLAFIAANGKKTGMDSKNVAIVWAPNLLKPRELELSAGIETLQVIGLQAVITEQLIKHQKFLFDDEDEENIDDGCGQDGTVEEADDEQN